jgi:hypothetical protein
VAHVITIYIDIVYIYIVVLTEHLWLPQEAGRAQAAILLKIQRPFGGTC